MASGREGRTTATEVGQAVKGDYDPWHVPDVTRGTIDPSEPIADPQVQAEIERAWIESNPGSFADPSRREQGGWIVGHDDGTNTVQRWPDDHATNRGIPVPPRPEGARGSFHTHPNIGPEWEYGPSGPDWRRFGDVPASEPHYIIARDGVYRLTYNRAEFLGAVFDFQKSSNVGWAVAGGAVAAGAGIGLAVGLSRRKRP